MARIRTIKPDFFTSEQIVDLSPLARLLFIATWCEADREGRLTWRPKTFKLRYFPADECDIDALARELVASGLVHLYGDGLAHIPMFTKHQHVNPRESESTLPDPRSFTSNQALVGDALARVTDATVTHREEGRKGKEGKEGEKRASPTGSRLPDDWSLPAEWSGWAAKERPDLDIAREAAGFADYWHGAAGAKARKADWQATWRNWIRNANERPGRQHRNGQSVGYQPLPGEV